jgi:hypothetical protein
MKSCNVFLTIVAVAVIALALGASIGYDISSGRTTTSTVTKTLTITTSVLSTTISFVTQTSTFVTSAMSFSSTNTSMYPSFFNETILAFVNYSGAWGLSYQTHVGIGSTSSATIESGNFFGHAPTNDFSIAPMFLWIQTRFVSDILLVSHNPQNENSPGSIRPLEG